MNYQKQPRARAKSTQEWAVGNMVKVGFLSLKVVGGSASKWILENKEGSKKYAFEPHLGLFSL